MVRMTTRIYVTTGKELVLLTELGNMWDAELKLVGLPTQCVAVDPLNPSRIYCGTFGEGLWSSMDAGETWSRAGQGIAHPEVMSVSVSAAERVGDHGVVWAGTEPSAIFRSGDGGLTWLECPGLAELPSAPTWSFPPRPWTSHVRWIAPDPIEAGRIFAVHRCRTRRLRRRLGRPPRQDDHNAVEQGRTMTPRTQLMWAPGVDKI